MSKSIIDIIGRDKADELMGDGVREAADKARALGLPETVKIDGEWVKRYPDGRIEPIEKPADQAD